VEVKHRRKSLSTTSGDGGVGVRG